MIYRSRLAAWPRSRPIHTRLFAVAAVVVTGCDLIPTNPDPPLGTVRGLVTLDGVPAPNMSVVFEYPHPIDSDKDITYVARTAANGEFEVQVPTGAASVSVVKEFVECPAGSVNVDVGRGENRPLTFACLDVYPFTLSAVGGFNHNTGVPGHSRECKLITTSPPRPGATYSMTVDGPTDRDPPGDGVVPGQGAFTGTLDENGTALVRVLIRRLGTYRNTITVTSKGGVARGLALDVLVNAGPSPNPCQ